jgi:hypothetical protein
MNLFYVLWPGLLKCDDFLYDFVTPILKVGKVGYFLTLSLSCHKDRIQHKCLASIFF